MALATTGAITGKDNSAMVTKAWISNVMNRGIQERHGALDIQEFSQFSFQNLAGFVFGQVFYHPVMFGAFEAGHVR